MHAQAHTAVPFPVQLDGGIRCNSLHPLQDLAAEARPEIAVGLQTRVDVAVVVEVGLPRVAFRRVHVDLPLRDARIQPPQPETRGSFLILWNEKHQPFDGQIARPPPKVVEPDQAESEGAVRPHAVRGNADRGQAGQPALQQRTRVARRKAVLQVELAAQFGDPPERELSRQQAAELLAERQASSPVSPRWPPPGAPSRSAALCRTACGNFSTTSSSLPGCSAL